MTYIKRSDVPVDAGEAAFELAGGLLVAVLVDVGRNDITNISTYLATARVVNADGSAVTDAAGQPIRCSATHSATAALVDSTAGAFGVLREMALLVMGLPPTLVDGEPLIAWADEYRSDASIHTAIASAQRTGVAPLHALL